MKTLLVGNYKGGCGKTAVSKFLAEGFALEHGLRTLLIDLDPQCNLSGRFTRMVVSSEGTRDYVPDIHPDYDPNDPDDADWDGYSDSSDIWFEGATAAYPATYRDPKTDEIRRYDNLNIIPAHGRKLASVEEVRRPDIQDQVINQLALFLRSPDIQSEADICVIDTRPSKGPLVEAGMYAASHLLIPTQLEDPSVEGLHGTMSLRTQTNDARARNDQLQLVGILPNMVQSLALHQTYLADLCEKPETGPHMMKSSLPQWVMYKEAMLAGQPSLFLTHPKSRAVGRLREVVDEVLARMGVQT